MRFKGQVCDVSLYMTEGLTREIILKADLKDEERNQLYNFKGNDVVIDIELNRDKRSLDANAYFWKLCDLIAKKLGSDKDTIYIIQLSRYGVFQDLEVIEDAVPALMQLYRYCEELYSYEAEREAQDGDTQTMMVKCIRCYIGSSHYNTKEMSDLIQGTVNDAQELGIDTWTPEEIEQVVRLWKGR